MINEKTPDLNDFNLWKEDRVTKYFFKFIAQVIEEKKQQRLHRRYIEDPNGLLELNKMLGYCDALEELQNIFFSDVVEEEEPINEKS